MAGPCTMCFLEPFFSLSLSFWADLSLPGSFSSKKVEWRQSRISQVTSAVPQAMLDRFPWDSVGSLLLKPDYSQFVPVTSWSSTPCPEHINSRKSVKVTFPDPPGFVGQVHPAGAAAGICLAQPLPINLLFFAEVSWLLPALSL